MWGVAIDVPLIVLVPPSFQAEVMPTPVKRLGVQGFGESGDAKGLYAKHGLDPAGIAGSVRKFLNR